MKAVVGLLFSCALMVLASGCGDRAATDPAGPRLELTPCPPEERIPDGLCGTLSVYEDRDAASGRRIDLRVVVLPALSGTPEPDPLFILAGGPGQAATEIIGAVQPAFRDVHRTRDMVFVDQRGTGESNGMQCDLDDGESGQELLVDPLVDDQSMNETLDRLRACADSLPADPRLYTTPIAMDDLEDVRQALGYEQINLWGASYGTRAGLVYMRRHPDRVRTAILDGLAPPTIRLPLHMGRDGQRALGLLLRDCADQDDCREAFPDLAERLDGLLARLRASPLRTQVVHPRTGVVTDVSVTPTSLVSVIRSTLYNPYLAALLPLAIREASEGRLEPLASLSLGSGGGAGGIYLGMFLSVVCAEDLPLITAEDRAIAEQDPLFGTTMLDAYGRMCQAWPTGEVGADYADPVSSSIPTLLLSGELDPVTPPVWAEQVGQTLSSSLQIVVPGSGHNVFGEGCLPDLMEEFIASATVEGLDVTCVEEVRRPTFFDGPLGPGTAERP